MAYNGQFHNVYYCIVIWGMFPFMVNDAFRGYVHCIIIAFGIINMLLFVMRVVVFLLNVPISFWAIFQMSFCAIKPIVISTYGYNIVNLF